MWRLGCGASLLFAQFPSVCFCVGPKASKLVAKVPLWIPAKVVHTEADLHASIVHTPPALLALRHCLRDALGLLQFAASAGADDDRFRFPHIARRRQPCLHLVLRPDVIGWPQ